MHSKSIVGVVSLFGVLCCVSASLDAVPFIEQCRKGDMDCIFKSVEKALPHIFEGIPAIGSPPTDPLNIKIIQSDVAGLNFTLTNVLANGMKSCKLKSMRFEDTSFSGEMNCKLQLTGDYELSGKLLILPVEGEGAFSINAEKLNIKVSGEMKTKTNDEGKPYLKVTSFKHETEALAPIVFDFKNLYNGNKELSDATHTFANTNYKDILHEIGTPILKEIITELVKIANIILKNIPYDTMYLS